MLKDPLKWLMCFILLSPFAGTSYLREGFLEIPGFKPFLVLGFFVFLISLLNYQKASRMPKYAYYFGLAVILIFSISIFRSLKHLHIFNRYFEDMYNLNVDRYLLSFYIKDIIFFLPFVVIIKYANTDLDLNRIMDVIYFTTIVFSIHLLYEYIKIAGWGMQDMSVYYSDVYLANRNELAMFFICGLPFAIRKYFLNKKIINIIFILIILTSIACLLSRTGYFTALFAIVAYLTISKRKKMLPVIFIVFALVGSTILVSTFVFQRATLGLKEENRDVISAGRIDHIWIPLIEENVSDPKKFMFGDGRNAIRASNSLLKGRIIFTGNPHNAYLELLIDSGIISLIIIVSFYYVILRNAFHMLKHTTETHSKENLYACIVSILCFLIAGMAGQSFFPRYSTVFLWVILGCTVASLKLLSYKEMSNVKA
jgi:O-antigen ligase